MKALGAFCGSIMDLYGEGGVTEAHAYNFLLVKIVCFKMPTGIVDSKHPYS